jgi:hypothetical protein
MLPVQKIFYGEFFAIIVSCCPLLIIWFFTHLSNKINKNISSKYTLIGRMKAGIDDAPLAKA